MDIKVLKLEDTPNCVKKVQIEIPSAEIQNRMTQIFDKMQKTASLPGFRAGKVPRKMLETRYTADVRAQAIQEILPEAFDKIAKENNINTVSDPYVTDIKNEPGKPVEVTIDVEVRPVYELADYSGISIKRHNVTVSDEEIEKELSRIQENSATYTPITDRPAQEGDWVRYNYTEKIKGIKSSKGENQVELGKGLALPEIEKALIGQSVKAEVNVELTYPADYADKKKAGKQSEITLTVTEIKEKHIPALDDELAKDLGQFENLDQLRNKIKEELLNYKEAMEKEAMRNQILDYLVEKNPFDLPASMVHQGSEEIFYQTQMRMRMNGQTFETMKVTPDDIARKSIETAKRSIRTAYIIDDIATRENIQVTDEELDKAIAGMAAQYHAELDQYKQYLAQKKKIETIRHDLRYDKVMDFLMGKANIETI
jgi:trigger factor